MYVNTVFLSVKYGRILRKYDNSRKRSEDAQIIFVFTFILFYHFRFDFSIIVSSIMYRGTSPFARHASIGTAMIVHSF